MGRITFGSIAVPACVLLFLTGAVELGADRVAATAVGVDPRYARLAFATLGWVAGAALATRLVQAFGWNRMARKSGKETPSLLVQITNVLIYASAALGIAGVLFDVSLTGVIATSSVIGLVVGFALKSIISDTFSGIALSLDQGFKIGDFIMLVGRPGTARISGQVQQINWRSTYLVTPENSMLMIPNTLISESIVLNFSRPEPVGEFELVVTLDFEVPSERALRVLLAAVQAAARENDAIWDCKAWISEVGASGIAYKIIYMLDLSRLAPGKAKNIILGHVERQMKMTGLTPAHSKVDNWQRETPERDQRLGEFANRVRLLGQVTLFAQFAEAELSDLAARMTMHRYPLGTQVIAAGAPGQSMFVLGEGLASVLIAAESGNVDVATLRPGDIFGEMSLLAGEPRSATIMTLTDTVAYEIDKADLMPLLDANPDAAEMLAAAVAERRLTSAAGAERGRGDVVEERMSLTAKILMNIRCFFGYSGAPAHMVNS
jgi:small-conductance mechanosensitive channel/CRP-like cAMP-binding protein